MTLASQQMPDWPWDVDHRATLPRHASPQRGIALFPGLREPNRRSTALETLGARVTVTRRKPVGILGGHHLMELVNSRSTAAASG